MAAGHGARNIAGKSGVAGNGSATIGGKSIAVGRKAVHTGKLGRRTIRTKLAVALALLISSGLLSGCVVEPGWGWHHHHHHDD